MKKLMTVMTLALSLNVMASEGQVGITEIKGYKVNKDGVSYTVHTGGCTAKSDFTVALNKSLPPQPVVTREVEDRCEAFMPNGKEIFFTWNELGVTKEEFANANPFTNM